MTTYTPGPWRAYRVMSATGITQYGIGEDKNLGLHIATTQSVTNAIGDARLIALAPELLDFIVNNKERLQNADNEGYLRIMQKVGDLTAGKSEE